jgi:hypothetical protein
MSGPILAALGLLAVWLVQAFRNAPQARAMLQQAIPGYGYGQAGYGYPPPGYGYPPPGGMPPPPPTTPPQRNW